MRLNTRQILETATYAVAAMTIPFYADNIILGVEIVIPPESCCAIQECPGGGPIAVQCRAACPPGSVCAPDGGCDPFTWALPLCEFPPIPPDEL